MKMVAAFIAGATAFVAASAVTTVAAETATVTLSIPAQRVAAHVTLTAAKESVDLPTQRITATATESQRGGGRPAVVSTYATGAVVFGWFDCTRGPCPFLEIPAGTEVSTQGGVHYRTAAGANFPANGSSAPIPIQAVSPGPGGNTGAGTIVVIDGNKGSLIVTNPQPVTGGATRATHVVLQADFDRVRTALTSAVTAKVFDALRMRAVGMGYAPDLAPAFSMISDHAVGDEAAAFTITMTASLGAMAFSDSRARSLIRSALTAQVPPSEELTSDPVQTSYDIEQANPNGEVKIVGTATGYATPRVSTRDLRARIAGLRPRQAREALQRMMPGGRVDINISPVDMPWLPLLPSRIRLRVVTSGP